MNAVNLYALTRKVDKEMVSLYEKALSQRDTEMKRIRKDEFVLIRLLVDKLLVCKIDTRSRKKSALDGWYYSFSLPRLSKEFDLLKIGKDSIINIELKSRQMSDESIIKQLNHNRHYLSHISEKIYSYSYMHYEGDGVKLLEYSDNKLTERSMEELTQVIREIGDPVETDIESLFEPKNYLISPFGKETWEKFLQGQYFLSDQQDEIKREMVKGICNGDGLWGISGSAGTGKTLLLYDIAKKLSSKYRVCVVHSGILCEEHGYLDEHMENTSVIAAKSLTQEIIDENEIICVDESHRMYPSQIELILDAYSRGMVRGCIFSYDFEQVLSESERTNNNPERLRNLPYFKEKRLTGRIRTNEEVISFIGKMMDLHHKNQKTCLYKNIDIVYANNNNEAKMLKQIFQRRGYTFISITPSRYVSNSIDDFSSQVNSHTVIGQEFDNVVVVLDNNFWYSQDGKLDGNKHPNPEYLFPRLFYQNVTRAREKLCIIVLENAEIFEILLRIKENRLSDEFSFDKGEPAP